MTILAIDWGGKHKIFLSKIEAKGSTVIVETEDGGKAYKKAGDILPDLIIFLEGKISHSIQTAKSIRERKKTAEIPLVFIDPAEAEKVSSLGKIHSEKEFLDSL